MELAFKVLSAAVFVAIPFLYREMRRLTLMERACQISLAAVRAEQKVARAESNRLHDRTEKTLNLIWSKLNTDRRGKEIVE